MRISTAGVVMRDGRYLVTLRKPGTSIGVKWEFPGGKAEAGETPDEALTREFQEELSLTINVREEIFEGHFFNGEKKYKLKAFSVELITPLDEMKLTEHSEYRLVSLDEMKELPFPSSDSLIRDYLIQKNS
ncbi:MAG: NUDIX domain-containing protein [Spirochaetales bacterium]|nr:NUDIX domain-containing protein [Spirochaetales bacterium]